MGTYYTKGATKQDVKGEKLQGWFIAYLDRMGRYVEENFDTKKEAVTRMNEMRKSQQGEPELWTRKR